MDMKFGKQVVLNRKGTGDGTRESGFSAHVFYALIYLDMI